MYCVLSFSDQINYMQMFILLVRLACQLAQLGVKMKTA